jgi:arylsulfatase A-like enzyme
MRAVTFLLAITVVAVLADRAPAADAPRPNFLFIYTDDQRWDALGVVQREQGDSARFPWFRTPNLDRLAADGVRFRNAFVVNSLCSPSRACFLTGRYTHLNGVANNHTPFPADAVTYTGLLRHAGYATGYVGKFHMGQQTGKRPGCDFSASFIGQGRYEDCPFEVNGETKQTTGWVDDVSTDFAAQFLTENKLKPFCLIVGYKSSHGPWSPPERAKDRFTGEQARPPANADAQAPYKGKFTAPTAKAKAKNTAKAKAKAEAKAKAAANPGAMVRNYFRTLSAVDDNVGRLLKTLDDLGVAENTVVVFTSDNGYYLGEHGLGDKRSAYDESLRIPFLVRFPKLGAAARGKVLDQMILNVDLGPTFLDLAGVAVPKEMQGRSWRPLLESKPTDWRKAFFYEYFFERNYAIPTVLAVRTETAKFITYPGHEEWDEAYDLKADPLETKNLVKDPAAKGIVDGLRAEFARQAKAVDYRVPPTADPPP